ncbi:MAG: MotA/TolQ/ExbB proton channel family protein [Gammaproteobacteria bacterium]|jgi:chemotaxis protein MotA|nr:MotA/TolQ/ExbB proton channel family protein [Gammaproteobacteria bacterium]
MDLATLIGLACGLIIIVAAMVVGSSIGIFINVPSVLIVLGGTAAATLMKFPLSDFIYALKVGVKLSFVNSNNQPNELIKRIMDLADKARKGGLLVLEEEQIDNTFLKRGVQLGVDGYDPELVKKLLQNEMDFAVERQQLSEQIFRGMGDAAPAFGMVGTLVGLVQMLSNMSDPSSIGPSMAVALLTTLYGAIIANLICIPIADKISIRNAEVIKVKGLLIAGVGGILDGDSPRIIEDVMSSYLADDHGAAPVAEPAAEAG